MKEGKNPSGVHALADRVGSQSLLRYLLPHHRVEMNEMKMMRVDGEYSRGAESHY